MTRIAFFKKRLCNRAEESQINEEILKIENKMLFNFEFAKDQNHFGPLREKLNILMTQGEQRTEKMHKTSEDKKGKGVE